MRTLVVGMFVIGLLWAGSQSSEGSQLLGQFSDSQYYPGSTPKPATYASVFLEIDTGSPSVYYLLGKEVLWTAPGSVVFDSGNEPDWNGFVTALTNGTDEPLAWHIKAGGMLLPSNRTESQRFGTTPDFLGVTIDSIRLDVTSLDYLSHLSADITVSVYGTPEPGTVLLFGLGALGLIRRRR